MTAPTIRRAQPHDAEALAALCADHATFERSPLATPPDAARLREAMTRQEPSFVAWVVEQGASLLGYASGSVTFNTWQASPWFMLDCLYLVPEARGAGLGRALMAAVRLYTAGERCGGMEWVTPDWNEPAIGFYRALGANDQLRRRFRLAIEQG